MKVSLSSLKLLLGIFASLLISACSDDGSSSSSADNELKAVNLYLTSNDTNNEIANFNPKTGVSKTVVNYDSGEQTLLLLNTDNDEQGHEKVIYSLDNSIYSLDSENIESKSKLASFATTVCIFPNAIPDQSSFEGSTKGERILVDQSSIFITARTDTGCDARAAKVKKIDFSDTRKITIREVSAAQLWGERLFDYTYKPSPGEENQDIGRYGFLGANYNSELTSIQLNFYDEDNNVLWETSLPFSSSLPTIHQVTETEVLVQVGGKLYLNTIEQLFEAATVSSDEIPTGSIVEALFSQPLKFPAPKTTLSTDISTLQIVSNDTIFALVDDGEIFFYDTKLPGKTFISHDTKNDSVEAIKIDMLDNGTLLRHYTFSDTETLSSINASTGANESLVTVGADSKINFYTQNNNIYINKYDSLDRSSIWYDSQSSSKTYNNSLFAFSENYRTANSDSDIFLISSNDTITLDGYLTNASLYAFDPKNKTTGRKRFIDGNNITHDFIIGTFLADIKEVSISEVFNDVYGKLTLKTVREISDTDTNVTDTYFFNPTETKSAETKKTNNKALQLIKFIED